MNPSIHVLASVLLATTLATSADAGTPYCFGDGTGTACPCGNNDPTPTRGGCLNSASPLVGPGAVLGATGIERVASDSVVLTATGLLPSTPVLFYQGTAQAGGGAGVVFGDGLRCVGGTIIRLGIKTAVAGTASYPGTGDLLVSVKGALPALGGTREYQAWFRDAFNFCTSSPFNLSNGLTIVWT